MTVLYHKPYQVLSQFNRNPDYPDQAPLPVGLEAMGVRPLGRLDYDSEGLLLLSDDLGLEQELMAPAKKLKKTYLVQVQGVPPEEKLDLLREGGVTIRAKKKFHNCAPAEVRILPEQPTWIQERNPAVNCCVTSCWLELTLTEGKNRQVRRMTAAIGCPTLRLIRTQIGEYQLGDLASGEYAVN